MRANGVSPSSLALVSRHDHHGRCAVVQRAGVTGGDGAVRPEHRLELADLLVGGAGARAVVLGHHCAVGQCHGHDLALEEAAVDGLLGAVLRTHAPMVLILAADAGEQGDVLGGLAHRDVDVGDRAVLAGVVPLGCAKCRLTRTGLRLGETRVLAVRPAVGAAVHEAGHRLDARGDERVALARLDRVERHPGGLQRRRAVAVDRGAWQEVVAQLDGDGAADVVARLARGLAAAHDEVVDVARVKGGHLVQRRPHHLRGKVIGPHVDQGPLVGATDRRARGRDDDGFGHDGLLESSCWELERT